VVEDEVFPAAATAITARELGTPQVEPVLSAHAGLPTLASPVTANLDGVTAGLFQYGPPADHAFLLEHEDQARSCPLAGRYNQSRLACGRRSIEGETSARMIDRETRR